VDLLCRRVRPEPGPTRVRTTWAPRGQTPILYHHWRRGDNLSMAAVICYHPDGRRVRLLTDHA
jgi:hypothetical protein